ncbi:hypothetical protein LSAT2_014122 [Lamellibrachia satsuma]|nr:hypothetical protein LSAT2_014122 [Lamellibrachia satsuma]
MLQILQCISHYLIVKLHPTSRHLRITGTWRSSALSHFKVPRHIRFVGGYPMTVTGKVQKYKMRHDEAETHIH